MKIYIPRKYICKHTKFDDSLFIETRNKEPKSYDDIIGFGGYTFTCEDISTYTFEEIKIDLFNAYLDMKNISIMIPKGTIIKGIEELGVKPLNQEYISVNFETQGKCPNCGERVVDGYSRIDKICPNCGAKLKWRG